ncbi:MAG: hypothetical protein AVDCRST_MAG93-7788 [uncultured Chloroflexia bacterium]|uniref:Uncharacterized protein n=1 Tax=uncultured Chloroflexia bacterium TaxID=1672391 RepID=A0A6J4MQ49_9CHLR|nr:MAG: hypothetical protein AVDCRST_MAG93-7788 [uncultured Chloroflexia bacterium]
MGGDLQADGQCILPNVLLYFLQGERSMNGATKTGTLASAGN